MRISFETVENFSGDHGPKSPGPEGIAHLWRAKANQLLPDAWASRFGLFHHSPSIRCEGRIDPI